MKPRHNLTMRTALISFSGLPATGKSTIAYALAREIGAVWLRIDSIEQAILASGVLQGAPMDDAGYRAAYAVAEDNLRLGRHVVADCVNGWALTRDVWRTTGLQACARVIEVEVVCSDAAEHRRRVETRTVDVPGLKLPDWQAVLEREYHPWTRDHLTIDTAGRTAATCVEMVMSAIGARLDG
jgi:predicted kinase